MDEQVYCIRATDGTERVWMWDSREFRLAAGETKTVPRGAAEVAKTFFTKREENKEPASTVEIRPYEERGEITPAAPAAIKCSLCQVAVPITQIQEHTIECLQGGQSSGFRVQGSERAGQTVGAPSGGSPEPRTLPEPAGPRAGNPEPSGKDGKAK